MTKSDLQTPRRYLAIDLGASSGRAVLGVLADGRMATEEVHRFTTPVVEQDGHLYWDIEVLWREILDGVQKALRIAPDLRSVSVDSWAVDYVRLDADRQPIALPYTYRDSRLDGVMESAFNVVPKAEIYATTGIQFLPFNSLYQVLADKRASAAATDNATVCRLCIADFFNFRLLGGSLPTAAIDDTMASTTQLMDVQTRTWSRSLMERFGVDDGTWPRIVPAGTRLGPSAINRSVDVVASCSHDTGAAVAATPATGNRWAYVSCGTWSLFGVELDTPLVTQDALDAGFTNEAGIDGTIRFLKNLTGFWILQECVRLWGEEDGAQIDVGDMMDAAEQVDPVSDYIDMQDPRFLHRGNMPETLRSYLAEKGLPQPVSRAATTRLIVESMAESNRATLRQVEHLTDETIETLHLFGGGSQSRLLCQLTADRCGIRVVAGPTEATALGNLLVQARTMGDLAESDTIRTVSIRSSELAIFDPRNSDHL